VINARANQQPKFAIASSDTMLVFLRRTYLLLNGINASLVDLFCIAERMQK